MPGNVDSLQVKIEAQAAQAFKNIDALTKRMRELARMTGTAASAMGRMGSAFSSISQGTKDAGQSASATSKAYRWLSEDVNAVRVQLIKANATLDSMKTSLVGVRSNGDAFEKTKTSAESFRKTLSSITGAIGKVVSGLGHLATAGVKAFGNALGGVTGRLTGFFKGIVRIAKYRAIRAALRAITDGLKTGTENLYYFSQAYNTNFAPTMDRLSSSMLYLKNAFGAMFSPLIEYFAPAIETLIDKIVDAFNWVQKLFAQLTGKATWYKAVKVQKSYKDSTDNTTKAVKALREELRLMDFDELNNITENNNDNSPAAKADKNEPDPTTMFTIEETPNPMNGTLWENIKKKLYDWLGENGWLNEDGTINWKAIGTAAGEAIGDWFNKQDWAGIWETIKTTISDIWGFLSGFTTGLIGKIFPGSVTDGEIDWGVVGETIGSTLKSWIESIDWKAVFSFIVDILKDIWDLVDGLFDGLFPERKASDKAIADITGATDLYNKAKRDMSSQTVGYAGESALLDKYFALRADKSELQAKVDEISRNYNEFLNSLSPEQIKEFEDNFEHWTDVSDREFASNGFFRAYDTYRRTIESLEEQLQKVEEVKEQTYRLYSGKEEFPEWNTINGHKNTLFEMDWGRDDFAINSYIDELSDAIKSGTVDDWFDETISNASEELKKAFSDNGIEQAVNDYLDGILDAEKLRQKIADAISGASPAETWVDSVKDDLALIEESGALAGTTFGKWFGTKSKDEAMKNVRETVKEAQDYLSQNPLTAFIQIRSRIIDRLNSNAPGANGTKSKYSDTSNMDTILNATGRRGITSVWQNFKSLLGFAEGGYPQRGTMFYAGEAGAEFVGNINGKTGVVSGQEITGIGDAVWSTGNTTANILGEILVAIREKDLTISPSANLGKVVQRSQRLYATQTG